MLSSVSLFTSFFFTACFTFFFVFKILAKPSTQSGNLEAADLSYEYYGSEEVE